MISACETAGKNSADCLALYVPKSSDLALVVERWNMLPEAVRAGIVAMVRASDSKVAGAIGFGGPGAAHRAG
jgi:hypothetical protein